MSRQFVDQLRDGNDLDDVYLVTDKQLRANRNGNLYLLIELRDRTGSIQGRMWNAGDHVARGFDPGDFLHLTGKVQLFQGALQVILTGIERAEVQKVDFADFLPQTEQSIPKLTDRSATTSCGSATRTWTAECFLMDDAFMRVTTCPPGEAAPRLRRRLLEHVVSMMDAADKLLRSTGVDRDLPDRRVLHDAGKTRD